jgi:hypothetical protein
MKLQLFEKILVAMFVMHATILLIVAIDVF